MLLEANLTNLQSSLFDGGIDDTYGSRGAYYSAAGNAGMASRETSTSTTIIQPSATVGGSDIYGRGHVGARISGGGAGTGVRMAAVSAAKDADLNLMPKGAGGPHRDCLIDRTPVSTRGPVHLRVW